MFFACLALIILSKDAHAATLTLSPPSGAFTVDSQFDVSIFLNTEGQSVNVVQALLSFPPDKLQIVSQATGKSVIGVWTAQPKFNNLLGRVDLQGAVPGGINVSGGLIATITFRVKSVGSGIVRFLDASRVLLHDGLGTDALRQTQNAVYSLILPPPAGPVVISETHPDQSKWYSNPTVVLRWGHDEEVAGYSYIYNDDLVDISDDISEGSRSAITYRNVNDGIRYFHIKALREGSWGGTTHFATNIDTTAPAKFPIEVTPARRTTSRQPAITFSTTDALSGVDHYELKLIPLQLDQPSESANPTGNQPFFIDAESPYIFPRLELGSYDIIARSYDRAGNWRETLQHLKIVPAVFRFISDRGLSVRGTFTIPWLWFWLLLLLLLLLLIYIALKVRRWHLRLHNLHVRKELPGHLRERLDHLKKYQSKYRMGVVIAVLVVGSLTVSPAAFAQQIEISPPVVSEVSRNISNEEIFYIGGKAEAANSKIIIYLQSLETGETLSQNVTSDKYGDWFYRHTNFLPGGNYLLWVQTKIADELSPPSPQIQITVRPTALQFGASRISYETLYFIIIMILLAATIALGLYIVFHTYHGRRKRAAFAKEMREAEESIRRGFAILRRDIQAELAVVRKAGLKKEIAVEEKAKEEQLLKDLTFVEQYIGKEVWDIEKVGYTA